MHRLSYTKIGIPTGLKRGARGDSEQSLPWYNPDMDEAPGSRYS